MNIEDLNKAICQLISDVELLKQDNKTTNKRLDVINENIHQVEEIASLIEDTISDNKIFDSFKESEDK